MADETEFSVGDRIRVVALPPYIKTAESMPMLRPPDIIRIGEEGVILDRRPGGYWGVRFERGAFLLDCQYFEAVDEGSSEDPDEGSSEDPDEGSSEDPDEGSSEDSDEESNKDGA